ncbi:hypothetical protein AB833_03300 [Chromatiales bacterium (ex Bugula neritina AB1)]|nr:hypothetical protein AB833_03300 [Chromatiales bacterium (ex Bugula neritina AB1)]
MGEVISIHRHGDNDIYRIFDTRGPAMPDDLDEKIKDAAIRATGGSEGPGTNPFRSAFVVIVVLSLLSVIVVQRFHYKPVSTATIVAGFAQTSMDTGEPRTVPWRQSKVVWLNHISGMEAELLREKVAFAEEYLP